MAISNFTMSFDQHSSPKYDLRPRSTRLAQSAIRSWRFEQSEGIRPAAYYAPYKYLPVGFQDVASEDWVVIPKGRIVSALSTEDSTNRMTYPSESGYIYTGFAAPEMGGAVMSGSIDASINGYESHINGLLTLANGGAISSGFYTANDVTAGTIKSTGALAAAGNAFTLAANAPIGVAFFDWYQDIRGKYLNYRMHEDGGHVLTEWFVEVPYVKVDNAGSYSGVNPQYDGTYANLTKYLAINNIFSYLTVNVTGGDVFKNGVFVQSDLLGNYKIQGGSSSLSQNRTVQTVGKIIQIDNRFPKDMLEDVLTYPRSGMPGSQTAGMPKFLFDFVYNCISIGTSVAPTVEGVYNAIRSGAFGLARIQLLVK
jgi:hypothetical protein